MTRDFDAIVVGLGATGSAAAAELARRGLRVLGLDRHAFGHDRGSSHGESRIIREIYYEHPLYVPLVRRAYELWARLEHECGEPVLHITGGLTVGPPDGHVLAAFRHTAAHCGILYEVLSAAEVRARHPGFEPADDDVALIDARAGWVAADRAMRAFASLARRNGAELRFEEPAVEWRDQHGRITVFTAAGEYRAPRLLVSAGAWTSALLPGLDLRLAIERQVLCWFRPAREPGRFALGRCPIFIGQHRPGGFFYGFPDLGAGVKAALYHEGVVYATPDDVDRGTSDRDVEPLRQAMRRLVPDAAGTLLDAEVCLFTNTSDEHFLIDFHPEHPGVVIASPCSGHGFKFAPAMGEVLADLLQHGKARFDLGLFRLDR